MTAAPGGAAPLGHVLRIGVTGARDLRADQVPRLERQVAALLRDLAKGRGGPPIPLVVLSPLAEGADRLVARMAVAAGAKLVCPLPFGRDAYVCDFKTQQSLDEFHGLLAKAGDQVLELDGRRSERARMPDAGHDAAGHDEADDGPTDGASARSYRAVGRLIVHNCDLMIGIWDGGRGKGRGGTADTIGYAARFGPPVVWLNAVRDAPPRWIEEAYDLRPAAAPRMVEPALTTYLERLLDPPEPPSESGHPSILHGLGHWASHKWHRMRARLGYPPPPTPLQHFLAERPHPVWFVWRAHGGLLRWMAGGRKGPWTAPRPPDDPVALAWFRRYEPADARAGEYAARYRSSYVWAFTMGGLALTAAASSAALAVLGCVGAELGASGLELLVLLVILGLVVGDGVTGWQRRAIEYRLLAELLRKQQALAPLGCSVPQSGAWATTRPPRAPEENAPPRNHDAWVAWLFSAWQRETPLATGRLDGKTVEAARVAALRDLIGDQIDYHTVRRAQTMAAGRRLVVAGEVLFLAVLVVIGIKLWLLGSHLDRGGDDRWVVGLGLIGTAFPAISAALVGIRAYAELELLAEQSDAMVLEMQRARQRVTEIDPAAPLASQELGGILAGVARLMLEDVHGWVRLFRAKVVEA